MQITADVSKISKTVQRKVTFILIVLSESSIHFFLEWLLPKKMLLDSHEVIFIKNETVLLWVTIP